MNPKYRNGTEVRIGDVAIGCWEDNKTRIKLVATICVIAVEPEARLSSNVKFVYLNGKPDRDNLVGIGSSDVMILMEDAFVGDIDQAPEKSWLERSRNIPAVER